MAGPAPSSSIHDVLARSFLRDASDAARETAARGARRMVVPAGAVLHAPDGAPGLALVESGLVRLSATARDGRQIAVRYARSGDELGIIFLFKRGGRPVTVQALTAAAVWQIDIAALAALGRRDAEVAWRIAAHLAALLDEATEEFTSALFGTMPQRVARHLLDLSSASGPDAPLAVPFSHQQIAEGLGTAREVVSRVVRALQARGLVRARRAAIEIVDAEGLYAVAHPAV